MHRHRFGGERIDVRSHKSFADVTATLEKDVPRGDIVAFVQITISRLSGQEMEKAIGGMQGNLGFMVLAKIDHGSLALLLRRPKKMSVYLIGDPALANRMYEQYPRVGPYALICVSIYEDYQGQCHVTYYRPSGLLEEFDNEQIRAIARILDQRMESLADRLAR